MKAKDEIKHAIVELAARIMALEGVHDYRVARRKATQRLGFHEVRNIPSEEDISNALAAYHRLFQSQDQLRHLKRLRELALEALKFFQDFSPRVVGSVWDGTAGRFSPILLHLFPRTPEEVMHKLWEADISFEEISIASRSSESLPSLCFYLDDTRVELWIFSTELKSSCKKSRAPGGALNQLEALIHSM